MAKHTANMFSKNSTALLDLSQTAGEFGPAHSNRLAMSLLTKGTIKVQLSRMLVELLHKSELLHQQ